MIEFRDSLIKYLQDEKEFCEAEIASHKLLSREEKAQKGLLICDAIAESLYNSNKCIFRFSENNTKVRLGDMVKVRSTRTNAVVDTPMMVLEVSTDYFVIETGECPISDGSTWDIELSEVSMFDTFISVLESVDESAPGAYFLQQLAGKEQPTDESMFGAEPKAIEMANIYADILNECQMDALYYSIKQPSLRLIQGPPGTGKTHVLACIANIMSSIGMEVAIVAKTHQAVNNALNAIKKRNSNLNVIKIGQSIRSEGLYESVLPFEKYFDYLIWRKREKNRETADVVGMTLQASAVNMCLRNSGFKPQVVLVDEASQIPLAEAAIVGVSGAGSVIFIGDDRQMSPIFVEPLEKDILSVSIFQYIANNYPEIKDVLNVSYRMNEEICSFDSRNFYEPYGIKLISADSAKDRKLVIDASSCGDERITEILGSEDSIHVLNVSQEKHEEENVEEALFAAQCAAVAMQHGISSRDIAIVTPFRKQVNAIRNAFKFLKWPENERPLVDTVERLQGQDVEMIILSFSVSDKAYYSQIKEFLLNRNRLNVMVSRAKTKVVILKSEIVNLSINICDNQKKQII